MKHAAAVTRSFAGGLRTLRPQGRLLAPQEPERATEAIIPFVRLPHDDEQPKTFRSGPRTHMHGFQKRRCSGVLQNGTSLMIVVTALQTNGIVPGLSATSYVQGFGHVPFPADSSGSLSDSSI